MATHRVIHPSLYLRVNGQLQQVEIGHELTLSKEKGEQMVERKFAEAIVESDLEVESEKPKKRGRKPKKE